MSEMLLDKPPEYKPPLQEAVVHSDYGTAESAAELERDYGAAEKAVADVAIEGSGLVEVPDIKEADMPVSQKLGEQLSIENEPGIQWPSTDAQKGIVPSVVPESKYVHPPDMSSLEEASHVIKYITGSKAHDEWTSGKIGWDEFHKRTSDKTPRTDQQPLLRQNGQLFEQEKPHVVNPNIGVGAADGTFWHGSSQVMEPGDRLMPSGEVPDAVHRANASDRSFTSSSSPKGSSYGAGEKDFAFGLPRDAGLLPTPYGEHIYKVSSPNSEIVPVSGGKEVWAEGGGRIEKRMHPDFANNYVEAAARVRGDQFQDALPAMENVMQFVPEVELDVTSGEFNEKHPKDAKESTLKAAQNPVSGPEDVALPGLEEHGKRRDTPAAPSGIFI